MTALLGFDNGRSLVKTMSDTGFQEFPSAVSEARELKNPQNRQGDIEIIYQGQRYFVGQLAEREGLYTRYGFGDTKGSDLTLIQLLAACWLHGIYGQVNVSMGTPVDSFTSEERKAIREKLVGEHHFTVKGCRYDKVVPKEEHWAVEVQKVLISQECVAGFWADPQDTATYTIDAGAKTTNYSSYDQNRNYIERESGTLKFGWEQVKAAEGFEDVEDHELEEEEIQQVATAYAKRILDEVQKRGWNRPRRPVQLIGGMAERIHDTIKEVFPKAYVVPDPRRANVVGYYKLGRRIFNR